MKYHKIILTAAAILLAAAFISITSADPEVPQKAIIIDHNCVDLDIIPAEFVKKACALKVLVRHASVGMGINWGLDCLAGNRAKNADCKCFDTGLYNRKNLIFEPRGNPNSKAKVDDLIQQAATRSDEFDVFTMKFCYIDALRNRQPNWDYFRSAMEKLEKDYPEKIFVWWTIPLTRDGQAGTDSFNTKVRDYCKANGKILFDLADIESHEPDDPNDTKLTNDQGCETISALYTKEVHAGHLNVTGRIRVAKAFWHLMARIAGWQDEVKTKNKPQKKPVK